MRALLRIGPAVLGSVVLLTDIRVGDHRVTVAAAGVDRAAQLVAFPLPAGAPRPARLHDSAGRFLPLQLNADGTACFIVARQKAGEALRFTLTNGEAPATADVTVAPENGDLRVSIGRQPALHHRMDKERLPRAGIAAEFKRAGYLHPVFSPAGRVVTGDYPANHVHHHAVWSAWSKTEFQGRKPNFWEMAERTGTVEFAALDRTWNGPVHGGFAARQRVVDLSAPAPATVLDETWELTAYQVPGTVVPVHVFDLTITQACATDDPLVLPKYHYGGLGCRGPDGWEGRTGLVVLTANGETDRDKANLSRARWCYVGGDTGAGRIAGTAVLGHPDNFRAPQPVRVHPNMPFICFAPAQLGDWSIAPGRPYVARYRFVVTDGAPDPAFIEACWNGYARAADVKIEPR